ncbi:cytochrome P450 4c3 [Diachasma alloeum]|uniref:cytochrome P450 4c3 n=1 Tax=Diachasma alloeum TaxID=454923 RepID=UPI00073837A4|nr:cytochrome P450 4c3 [Diachasma alloeum]
MGETAGAILPVGSWVTLALSLGVISMIVGLFARRAMFLHSLRNVPFPSALPIIGNAYQLNCSLEDFFKKLVEWSKEFGDIYLLWLGPRPMVFVYRVEGVQALLSSSVHIDKSLEYLYLRRWLGNGLVINGGESWHFRRKLVTPTFHSGLLLDYLKRTIREANIMVACLVNELDNDGFDIVPYAKRAALDLICETTMGYHMNAQTMLNNDYVRAVEKMTSIMQTRFTNIWISIDAIFNLTSLGKEHERALNVIHSFVDKIIAERKEQWKIARDGNFNEATKKRPAFLDLLLEVSQDGAVLNDRDIRDEVNTFMFAGHDTVATSLSWFFYALGLHPEYQTKILEEYDQVIGTEEITLEGLNKLPWLDACVKEVWRLYPVVPLLARQIYQPIKIMNHDIPVGSTVLINTFLLHRDPRHFPEPEVFRPERFLPENPKPPTFAYIPFSAGSRNCIGWKFATMEVKVAILTVLKAYHIQSLETPDQLRMSCSIVLINANGLRVKISRRK